MALDAGNITLYGLIGLVLSGLLQWLREWQKHRTWSKNGNDLKEIKKDVKANNEKLNGVDVKVGEAAVKIAEIKTAVTSQAKHCKQTVERFDKTIGDQNQAIIGLAKNSGKGNPKGGV